MKNFLTGLLLAVVGGGLIRAGLRGDHLAWVTLPTSVVLIVGAVLVVLAAMTVSIAERPTCATSCGCGEKSSALSPLAIGLLALIIVGFSPVALNTTQVQQANHSTRVSYVGTDLLPDLPPGVPEISLREAVVRAGEPADNRLVGREITLHGQIRSTDQGIYLSRVSVICCAADARTFEVELVDPGLKLAEIPDSTWVKVIVHLEPGSANAHRQWIPLAEVTSAHMTEAAGYERG
ncbi:MAG: hypothetical protein Q4A31_09930 [Corynebacterium sp.]|uniref:TIGR03943 family putative permease subunit n=1 Tax=Corynebacterium sp. TaxID=1720 RepID=UPI0026DD2276|nr:hypothetical protein [Corynebacterium sp.]MDO4762225.1 hypothetical protein [Corynebacterium sp.]